MLVGADGGIRMLPVSTGTTRLSLMKDSRALPTSSGAAGFSFITKRRAEERSPGSTYYANFISGRAIHVAGRATSNMTRPATAASFPMFAAREVSRFAKGRHYRAV